MVWESVSTASRLFWRHLGKLVVANILWLLLSLPIVTWPAATAGLFYLVRRVVQEELEASPRDARLSDFWDGFRRHGLRSSALTAIDLAGVGVIAVALVFYGGSTGEPLRWLVGPIGLVGLVWITAQLYVYPLLMQRTGSRPWEILREALLMALGFPLASLSLLVTILVLLIASIVLAGPVLFVVFSAIAMLQTVLLRQVLIQRGEIDMVAQ
jgi:uncharacterized membrane protein YesL